MVLSMLAIGFFILAGLNWEWAGSLLAEWVTGFKEQLLVPSVLLRASSWIGFMACILCFGFTRDKMYSFFNFIK